MAVRRIFWNQLFPNWTSMKSSVLHINYISDQVTQPCFLLKLLSWICKFTISLDTVVSATVFQTSLFRISAKKRQRIASSSWRGISSSFLYATPSTRWKRSAKFLNPWRCLGSGLYLSWLVPLLARKEISHLLHYCRNWAKLPRLIPPLSTNNTKK